jgi:hypothetical protein
MTETRSKPISPRCLKCGEQPEFITSILDPKNGRAFHMFSCRCGNKTWIPDRAAGRGAMGASGPLRNFRRSLLPPHAGPKGQKGPVVGR